MSIPKIFQARDPTRGNLFKISLLYSFYLWINTAFWIIVNLLNLFWVSKLGEEAIAAVGIGGSAFAILMSVVQGIGASAYNLIGSFNREDKEGLNKLVKQILSLTWITSILLAIFGYFSAPALLRLLGADPEVLSLAVTYFRICSLGGIISLSFWPLLKMVRSTWDMFRPMLFMALVLGLQAIFDYFIILGNWGFPRMGVVGAAWSSTVSAMIGFTVAIWMLARGSMFVKVDFRNWSEFRIRFKTLKEIFRIAGFDTMESLMRTVAIMIMMGIVASFGTMVLTAYAIGQRFFKYSSQFGFDVGETTAIVLSNNLGAGDQKRAQRSGWVNAVVNAFLLGIIGLIFFIFANQIIGFFSQNPEVISVGSAYLRISTLFGLGYVFLAVGIALRRAFAGAGDTFTPLWIYLSMAAIQIGLAIILPKHFGLGINGVWLAILIGTIFYGSALATFFKVSHWKPKAARVDSSK